jgi:hypothetical protein
MIVFVLPKPHAHETVFHTEAVTFFTLKTVIATEFLHETDDPRVIT